MGEIVLQVLKHCWKEQQVTTAHNNALYTA